MQAAESSDRPRSSPPAEPDALLAQEKRALRRQLLDRRGERTSAERAAAQAANADHVLAATAGVETVCAYVPLASEPLPVTVLSRLATAGHRVLVPVVTGAAPLDWVDYVAGVALAPGALGIARPVGPSLGAQAITGAGAVLVPALAVDARGFRLGRGGGHYDRSLALLGDRSAFGSTLIGVIFDDERLAFVPSDAFDIAVDRAICPTSGMVAVG